MLHSYYTTSWLISFSPTPSSLSSSSVPPPPTQSIPYHVPGRTGTESISKVHQSNDSQAATNGKLRHQSPGQPETVPLGSQAKTGSDQEEEVGPGSDQECIAWPSVLLLLWRPSQHEHKGTGNSCARAGNSCARTHVLEQVIHVLEHVGELNKNTLCSPQSTAKSQDHYALSRCSFTGT